MTLENPRTGHESDPDRFTFSSVRIPPDDVLPPALRKLTAEYRDHQEQWRTAHDRHHELSSDGARRTAERSDAVLLGEAARSDKELPGAVNVEALEAAIEAETQTMRQHEAAARLIVTELDDKLRAAADKGAADALAEITAAQTDHAQALADLAVARRTIVTNAAALTYWRNVTEGAPTRWRGRSDGKGAQVQIGELRIPLENFDQLASAITSEAANIARAIDAMTGDEPHGEAAA